MALTCDKQLIYNLPQLCCFQNLMQYVSCHIYQAQILCHTVLHVYNSYIHIYIITQVILAFWLVLAYELLLSVRSQYYTKLIDDICLNQKKLFGIVGKLLHRSPAPQYPSCSSVADLANRFIGFFGEKIITIRHELEWNPMQRTYLFNEATVATTRLHRLSCPSYSTLLQIVHPLASKHPSVTDLVELGCSPGF